MRARYGRRYGLDVEGHYTGLPRLMPYGLAAMLRERDPNVVAAFFRVEEPAEKQPTES